MFFQKVNKRLLFFVLSTIVFSILVGFLAINFFKQEPPLTQIEEGRILIAQAIKVEANIYSPLELKAANNYWNQAMGEWKANNEKYPIKRNYSKAETLAKLAIDKAKEAKSNAIKQKRELKAELENSITTIKSDLKYVEFITSQLPLNHKIRSNLTPMLITLLEGEQAYNRNDFILSTEKLKSIESKSVEIKNLANSIVEEYFSDYSKWIKLDEEMQSWSKTNKSTSLVIDKFSRKCIVYKNGKKVNEFNVELGQNWLGDKVQSGDMATPEGKYTIKSKRSGNKTIYNKSLDINFPNEDDKIRFREAKSRGSIPQNARIGGSIAIHGGGGKGIDWTEGCVALENSDMDKLYAIINVGTPVAIVGSLIPLNKILESQ